MKKYDLLIVQKPLDIFNFLPLRNSSNFDKLHCYIIGNNSRTKGCTEILNKLGITYSFKKNHDEYYLIINYFISIGIAKRMIFFLKPFVIIYSSINWIFQFLYKVFSAKELYENVYMDPWKTKLFYLIRMRFSLLILFDGGYSTKSYQLLENVEKYGYLRGLELFLDRQRPLPKFLRKLYRKKIQDSTFHTYYPNDFLNPLEKVMFLNYFYYKKIFLHKKVLDVILILGIPNLIKFEDFLLKAREYTSESTLIYYRFHPTDMDRNLKNSGYLESLEYRLKKFNVLPEYCGLSLEWDLYFGKFLPKTIITYPSSSTLILNSLVGDRINIVIHER